MIYHLPDSKIKAGIVREIFSLLFIILQTVLIKLARREINEADNSVLCILTKAE